MLSDSIQSKLDDLSSLMSTTAVTSSLDTWRDIAQLATDLADCLLREGDSAAHDLALLLARVAVTLSKGIIANPEAGVKAGKSILAVLMDLNSPGGIVESHRKQAHAEAMLFFRDAQKEELLVQEATTFGDDEEQREMIMAIEQRIDELEAELLGLNPPVTDPDAVRSIFRQFHTLKGEGAICGIKSVADFCHGIETEIEDARSGGLILTDAIVAILQELAAILRPILAGKSRESIGEELIQSLMDELREGVVKAKELQHAGGTEKQDDASGGEDKFADFFAGFEPPPPREETPGTDAAGMIDMEDAVSATVPDAASGKASAEEFLDALFADTGSPGTAEADATSLADPGKGASNVAADNGEDDAPVTAALQKEGVEKRVEDNKVKAISVDVHRLDELLEIVGEVSLIGSYVTSRLHGNEELSLQTTNLLRACGRLQEAANSMRMTSIRPLFMTVRRAAVDAARVSRKLIDIDMEGIDTQVDRSIVESLSAALIHIIRNAVDHGIEPADVRRRSGKPERGAIRISASRTNSDIVIELGDDGRGLDLRAIRDKAVAMGKLLPDAALTNEELADLVFLPGLSTARAVTGLSGRGVGMEIVRDSIDSLRGKVALRTEEGQGTTVRMRFPLVVAAMDAMLVRVGANILALPVAQVRECFRPAAKDIGSIENRGTIVTIRGVILPVLFLGREFGIAGEAQAPEDGVLVVVETGEMLTAVLVDETIGSTQVVIRALEGPLAQSPLVAGAAILPDGRIGLVIETTRLTERVATTATKAFNDAGMRQAESSRQVDTVSIGANQVGMIDFTIAAPGGNGSTHSHVFAINAFKTREFVPLTQLHAIPNSPPGFAGMMLLRNNAVPVVHMGVVLGLLSESERRPEWEHIVLICEFSGKTVGFLVSSVERVSYISWEDIMPPPSTGGLIQIEYVVGTILVAKLKGTLARTGVSSAITGDVPGSNEAQVAFVLDFERIVGNVLELYGDMGIELGNVGREKKDGVRILLVEDSPLIRKQTRKALSAAGITVIEAGDGQEAWEKVEEFRRETEEKNESIFTRVDLILSDIEMPRMDGYTLTSHIKKDPALRVLPVLLHSSITNDNMISRAAEVEADGFIPKCDPKGLAEQLRKYL